MAVDIGAGAGGALSSPLDSLNIASLTQMLQAAFGGKTQGSSNTNTLQSSTGSKESPLALSILQQIIPGLQGQVFSQDFSKEAAVRDSMGGVQQILDTLKTQALPGVFAAEAASGGYNSTTRQLLTNNLSAKAAAQGQALVSDTAVKYAGAEAARTKNLMDAINSAVSAQQTTSQQGMQNTAVVSDDTKKGLLQNPLAQGALGIMTALSGIQGLAPGVLQSLAKAFGFSQATTNADGTLNWGPFGFSTGDETGIDMGPDVGVVFPGDPGYPIEQPAEWFTIDPVIDWVSQG